MISRMIATVVLVTLSALNAPTARAQATYDAGRWAFFLRHADLFSHRSSDRYLDGGIIEPHWMADGHSFWFADGPPDTTVIYWVDPVSNRKTELFDITRLRASLRSYLGQQPPRLGVPFRAFEFGDGERTVRFGIGERDLVLDLETYQVTEASAEERGQSDLRRGNLPSPDGRWAAFVKDYNVWLRSRIDGAEMPLTDDGTADTPWSLYRALWSSDGARLAAFKDDIRGVPRLPVVRWLGDTAEVEWVPEVSGKERLEQGPESVWWVGGEIHPDGHRVAGVGGSTKGEIWVIENVLGKSCPP